MQIPHGRLMLQLSVEHVRTLQDVIQSSVQKEVKKMDVPSTLGLEFYVNAI
jgi:hypothetical protein